MSATFLKGRNFYGEVQVINANLISSYCDQGNYVFVKMSNSEDPIQLECTLEEFEATLQENFIFIKPIRTIAPLPEIEEKYRILSDEMTRDEFLSGVSSLKRGPVTPEELLAQGECPCGSNDSSGCGQQGCPLHLQELESSSCCDGGCNESQN